MIPESRMRQKRDVHVPTPLFLPGRETPNAPSSPPPSMQYARRWVTQLSSKRGPETQRVPKTLWGTDEARTVVMLLQRCSCRDAPGLHCADICPQGVRGRVAGLAVRTRAMAPDASL